MRITIYCLLIISLFFHLSMPCTEPKPKPPNTMIRSSSLPLYPISQPRIIPLEDPVQQPADDNKDNAQAYMAMLDQWDKGCKKQQMKRSQSK